MSMALLKLLFICLTTVVNFQNLIANDKDPYKILFIGHAYGSHSEIDRKLDSDVIKILENENYDEFVFGGDFIYNCNDEIEFDNLIKNINGKNIKLTIGNHDDCEKVKTYIKNKYLSINQKQIVNNTLILYLNTSINNQTDFNKLIDYTINSIQEEKNVIIFCHQVIFSKNDFYLRTNSRDLYNYGNKFYEIITQKYLGSSKNIFIVTGDIGAFDYTPYSFYDKYGNFHLLATGIGNSSHKNGISIEIDEKGFINTNFLDIKNLKVETKENFSKLIIQLYQFPKLFLSKIKPILKPYIICLLIFIFMIFNDLFNNKKYMKKTLIAIDQLLFKKQFLKNYRKLFSTKKMQAYNKNFVTNISDLRQYKSLTYWNNHFNHLCENNVEGDLIECGVGNGLTLSYMLFNLTFNEKHFNRRYVGFDSFDGFPEPSNEDNSPRNPQKGEWNHTDEEFVISNLNDLGFEDEHYKKIKFVKGFFEKTFQLEKANVKKVALLHIDCDLYSSTKFSLETWFDKVEKNGLIIFDEYLNSILKFPGAVKAIDEFFGENKNQIKMCPYTKQFYFIKS